VEEEEEEGEGDAADELGHLLPGKPTAKAGSKRAAPDTAATLPPAEGGRTLGLWTSDGAGQRVAAGGQRGGGRSTLGANLSRWLVWQSF
jgi:hypothetical protein